MSILYIPAGGVGGFFCIFVTKPEHCGQCFESIKRSCSTIEKHHLKVIHGPKNSHSTPVDQKHKTQGPL